MTIHSYEADLTADQLDRWERDGFLVIPRDDILPPALADDLDRWTDEVSRYPETPGKWMMYFEKSSIDGERILNRVENFVQFHPGFRDLFGNDPFGQRAAQLVGEEVRLFKEKVNFKYPGGEGFRPHQDAHAWDGLYEGLTRQTTVAVGIDAATVENGCLELAPGCHQRGLIGSKWEEIPADLADGLPWVHVPMEPGDVVFFDSYTPHRSSPNRTARRRRMLLLTYNPASEGDFRERYYEDKRRSYPPDCEREPGVEYEYKI